MKPETVAFVAKANRMLARAEAMLLPELAEDAGRAAYLARFTPRRRSCSSGLAE